MKRIKKHIGCHYITDSKNLTVFILIVAIGIFGLIYSIRAYPEIFKTEISLSKNKDIDPTEPLEINFSQPVALNGYSADITVRSEDNLQKKESIKLKWENSNRKLLVYPEKFWFPGSSYRLDLPAGKNAMLVGISATGMKFNTISPKVTGFVPKNGEKNVLVDIEDPITINFSKPTKDFFIKLESDPASDIAYQFNPEKTQFQLLPKNRMQDNAKYNVRVLAKYVNDSDQGYREIYKSSFETAPPVVVNWEKDFNLRLEQAKKYTQPKILTGKYIDVNLSTQIMTIFENGKLLNAYLVSSGKRGLETPKGEHQIYNKAPRAWSAAYGLFMPHWMAIVPSGEVGIHELPEWPGGYKEGANHLGTPVSHGCVRLGVGAADRVYNWADIGTPVIVY